MIRGLLAVALAGGAVAATVVGTQPPGPAATVAGQPDISQDTVDRAVVAVDVGEVPRQFGRDDIAKLALTELVRLEVDTAVAARYGVRPDPAAARRELDAAARQAGGTAAYQQQLIRSPGLGWAGPLVYLLDRDLRARTAAAAVRALAPVPQGVLQAAYDQQLGTYQHAHLEVLTTPDEATATADAAAARKDPASFPALVRRDTDDDSHRADGGDYGPALARGQLYRQVDDAVFGAQAGAVLGPVAVQQSRPEYYVVRVLSLTETTFAQAESTLSAQALQPDSAYVTGALNRERSAVRVSVAVGRWDPASLSVQ